MLLMTRSAPYYCSLRAEGSEATRFKMHSGKIFGMIPFSSSKKGSWPPLSSEILDSISKFTEDMKNWQSLSKPRERAIIGSGW